MFNDLSEKNRKKMLLNVFVYYPLGLVLAISIGVAVLKYVGKDGPSPGLIIFCAIILIFVGVRQISQIYRDLLKDEDRNKDV